MTTPESLLSRILATVSDDLWYSPLEIAAVLVANEPATQLACGRLAAAGQLRERPNAYRICSPLHPNGI